MALSFCSGWNYFQHIKPELSFLQAEPEPPEELLDLRLIFNDADTSLDQLLEQSNEFSHPENYEDVLQYLNPSPEDLVTISPETTPIENFNSWQCPKRQKIDENHFNYLEDTCPTFMNDYVLDYCPPMDSLPELVPSLPEFPLQPSFTLGHAKTAQKSDAGLSQQSIAARQRRRKIAEKLQELGKLVPGGTKMNTAEMLKSAFNYVKFMQAQIGIMELMGSSQEAENLTNSHELEGLLSSPIIQEKLYSTEKCLIPEEFVQKVDAVECKPSVVKEIEPMMQAHTFSSQKDQFCLTRAFDSL